MKKIFAVVLLVISLAAVALADGPGDPPTGGKAIKPLMTRVAA
jgi:hypothetical protein